MKKFFLMTRGRTGSTAIIDELNKSQGLCVASELFLVYDFIDEPKKHFDLILPFMLWKKNFRGFKLLKSDKQLAKVYLSEAEKNAKYKGAFWFGFKVLSHHFNQWPFLDELLYKKEYKAIYLKRNIARQVLSGMVANKSGIYNTNKEVKDIGSFIIDSSDFEARIKFQEKAVDEDIKLLGNEGYDYIVVTYEEFCEARQKFYEKVFSFLGMALELPPNSNFNIIIKDLGNTIKNYDQISASAEKLGWTL